MGATYITKRHMNITSSTSSGSLAAVLDRMPRALVFITYKLNNITSANKVLWNTFTVIAAALMGGSGKNTSCISV
jgi:hypothetical protein